jgi:alkaline phosphatase
MTGMRIFFIGIGLFLFTTAEHTGRYPSASNAHSHNDYEQKFPFWTAWQHGFGSIEADVFLENGQLIVAHDRKEVAAGRTLDSLYLLPLKKCILSHHNKPFADKKKSLQLMIDIKSESATTLKVLVEKLESYPELINCKKLTIAISGNRPGTATFKNGWPSWIMFDGVLSENYAGDALKKIVMLSDNFANYSSWNAGSALTDVDRVKLKAIIDKAHSLNKKVRFWNAPDNRRAWQTFVALGVDYINTDHIEALSEMLKQRRP